VQEVEIKHWHDYEGEIRNLTRHREQREEETGRRQNAPLFRGLPNGKWGLQTSLERSYPQDRSDQTLSLLKYYWKAAAAKPAVETLTGKRWDAVPNFPQFKDLLADHKNTLDQFLDEQPGICEYLIYLRHHGFPVAAARLDRLSLCRGIFRVRQCGPGRRGGMHLWNSTRHSTSKVFQTAPFCRRPLPPIASQALLPTKPLFDVRENGGRGLRICSP